MSVGTTLPFDWGRSLKGAAKVANPGAGGTFKLNGRGKGVTTLTATGTYTLPSSTAGTELLICIDDTSVITIADASGTVAVVTGTSGTTAARCTATDSNSWAVEVVGVTAGGAAEIGVEDTAGYFAGTTVEAVTASLGIDAGYIDVPLTSFVDADGDPLAKFVDNASPNPGFNLANSEAFGIRWNNNATQNQPILSSVRIPLGALDKVLTAHVIASKTGATSGDATTFTFTAFANHVGSLHDDGADIGGATSAMTGAATAKTVQRVTRAFTTLTDALTGPLPLTTHANLTFTITPTSGTLGTDDVIVERIFFTYPK